MRATKHGGTYLSISLIVLIVAIAGAGTYYQVATLQFVSPSPHILWKISTPGTVNSVAISSDGQLIAAGVQTNRQGGGEVYLLNAQGHVLWSRQTNRSIASVSISSDGSYVLAGGWQVTGPPAYVYENGEAYMFAKNGSLLWSWTPGTQPVFSVGISPSERYVVVGTGNGFVGLDMNGRQLWNVTTGIGNFQMSASGMNIAIGTFSGQLYYLNGNGSVLWTRDFNSTIESIALSPDGKYLALGPGPSGFKGTMYLLNSDGEELWNKTLNSLVLPLAISADDRTIVAGTNFETLAFSLNGNLLWNNTRIVAAGIALSENASRVYLVTQGNAPLISAFNRNGDQVWSYGSGPARGVVLSEDGSEIVVGTNSGAIYMFSP